MKLHVAKDYGTLSSAVARIIVDVVSDKPDALLCLAAGDTPRLAYTIAGELALKENVDFSQCKFVALDEWVGIPPENEGSCQYFLRSVVFDPMNIHGKNILLFNALAEDLDEECEKADQFIFSNGGIDLMVVGVGRNGHIGFNEPGIATNKYSHVANLDETTTSVGQKYFTESTSLHQGITLGLLHLLEAKEVLMIANGQKKAEIIGKAIKGKISTDVPASVVREHSNATVIIDEEAAILLTANNQ